MVEVAEGSTRPDEVTPPVRADRRAALGLVLGALASSAIALMGAALALRLWHADLSVPFRQTGDINLALMTVRNMQLTGWFQSSDLLNAPLGQDLLGYPSSVGDLWNMAGLRLLSLALTPAQTINIAFLWTFAFVAATAFLAQRVLGVSARFAIPIGAVFAWLPYHFLRGAGHVFLSNYAVVPLMCVLALSIYSPRIGERVWSRRSGVIAALATAVLLGGTGLYYAAFGLVLLAAAGILTAVAERSWRPLVRAGVLGATTSLVLAVSALPNLLYRLGGGVSAVEGRSYAATEYYGLKLTNLLLPLGSHRIDLFGDLRDATSESFIPGEGSETLGLLGAIGLVVIVGVALLPRVRSAGHLTETLRPLGVLATVAFVVATVAGLNGLLAVAGMGQLRAWNRMSVVIAFLAMVGVAHLLDAAWARYADRAVRRWPAPWRAVVSIVAVGSVSLVALADQTSDAFVPDYAGSRSVWEADARFFTEVEAQLGTGAQVFQLPLVPFPESPPVASMQDYNHLRGYLHSGLAWSYGGLKGGPVEWQSVLTVRGVPATVRGLIAAGFDAIYVNRAGYADNGAAIEAEIAEALGNEQPLVDESGMLAVYDLRPYAARLSADGEALPDRDTILFPMRIAGGEGFYGLETAGDENWHWVAASATADLVNPQETDQKVVVRTEIRSASPTATVRIRIGDEETVVHLRAGTA
ncbi:MAG: hypothetical protein HGA44_09065, partial [Cellulomonadaceae bacterium]|nr:hypothetical protein [Cellulomonadaceae bacterium]